MFDTHARKAGLGCCWLLLAGLAMPAAAAAPGAADWRLTVDLGVLADSNITGSTDDETIPLYQDGIALPVPLDPALRARGDIAFSVAASAGVRVPIDEALVLVVDAEVYALDHEGATNDDLSLLAAVGPEIGWEGGEASLQLIGFQRSYGGTSVAEGYGLRARYSDEVGSGQRLLLALDLRVFESGYGKDFDGVQAGAYLTYQSVLAPGLSGSIGVFARQDWLGDDAFSSREYGAYAGLSRFLGPDLTGNVSFGLSRLLFDNAIPYLSPDPRADTRLYGTASITTRRAIGWGLFPSLSYNYNRAWSSTRFFNAERHRVRFGLLRSF